MYNDTFEYQSQNYVQKLAEWTGQEHEKELSKFDENLHSKWKRAMTEGRFRYTLKDCQRRNFDLLEGTNSTTHYPCMMLLNIARGFNRRKPDVFESMNSDFNPNKFNFTKIEEHEILFKTRNTDQNLGNDDCIIINVSPVDFCHVLFVPSRNQCLPQQMKKDRLLKAIELIKLSSQPGFRLGFNSLNAWASVNHLHFHGSCINQKLYCDTMPLGGCITKNCYLTPDEFIVPGFIIEDHSNHVGEVASTTIKITDLLHKIEIPYNLVITRKDGDASVIKILLCPRKSTYGVEKSPGFDVACLEIGGYFPIKTEECFNSYSPKVVREKFKEAKLDNSDFLAIVKQLKNLV